jgi:hypothetical protein
MNEETKEFFVDLGANIVAIIVGIVLGRIWFLFLSRFYDLPTQ